MDPSWKWIGIFPVCAKLKYKEKYLDDYAEFDGVQFHQKTIKANLIGVGVDEKCEYRCPHAGCPHILMAERPAGLEDYQVKHKGKHTCRSNRQCNVFAKPPEQGPLIQASQAKKRGRKPKQRQVEEEEVENDDPQVEIGKQEQDMQIVLLEVEGPQQNAGDELPAVQTILTARERCEQLQEMVAQLGLKFRGFVDDERYYITFDKDNNKVAGYNKSTMIEITIRPIEFGNNSLVANLRSTNGVRGTGNFELYWQIPEFAHFLWAVRGLCHETFVPLKERMYSKQNDSILLPEVEEPAEDTMSNGGGANGQPKTFSIMDAHPELRLEELADNLGLRLQRGTKNGINQLILKYPNQVLHRTKIRLLLSESETTIKLVELDNGKKRGDEEWQKFLGRTHFRYALTGVAVDLFGVH